MPRDRRDTRQKPLTVETSGVQLVRRLVGRADHHHALREHLLEQATKDDRVANVIDEQFVKTQHTHSLAQFTRQGLQRVGGAGQLERALMHPRHEVVEVLTTRGYPQALVELVHQPGFAAPHRPPQVNTGDRRMTLMQGLMTALQGVHRPALGSVGDEALLGDGVLIGGEGRVESHARDYDLQRDIQP